MIPETWCVVIADEEAVGPFPSEASAQAWARDNFQWETRTTLFMWDALAMDARDKEFSV